MRRSTRSSTPCRSSAAARWPTSNSTGCWNARGATHVFRVRRDPVMLVALALAGIATSEEQEAELALVQRMAEAVAR